MKKRVLSILSLILILSTLLAMPALAFAEPEVPEEPAEPEEPYVDIDYYNCGCSIDSSSGLAFCSSYAETAHANYKIYINISLQRYKDGYWQQYAGPWYNSGTGYCTSYKYYYVVPGYYYRTYSGVSVYDANGNFIESSYLYSPYSYY